MEEKNSLEQAIESPYRIAVINTLTPEDVVARCKRITLVTGRAVYDWRPDNGLFRLGIEHIFIPRTRTAADVLAYVTSSRHYGIYLLQGFEAALKTAAIERQMHKLLEKQDNVRRLVCLVGENVELPASLAAHAVAVRPPVQQQQYGT